MKTFVHISSGNEEVALAMIDLDSFKQVNDHYGHAVGDQLIELCAQLIRDVCGEEARCYRLGGDEFAAVMAGKVSGTILEGMCRTLLERLGTPVTLGHRQIAVGASIGLTRSHGRQSRALVRNAAPRRCGDGYVQARREDALHLVQRKLRPPPRTPARDRGRDSQRHRHGRIQPRLSAAGQRR